MVTLPEDAAQLLYIVDYIADWARDVYRANVLHCLSDESSIPSLGDSMVTQISHVTLAVRNRSSIAVSDTGDVRYTSHREINAQERAPQPPLEDSVDIRASPTPGSLFGSTNTHPGNLFRGRTMEDDDATSDSSSTSVVSERWSRSDQNERSGEEIFLRRQRHGPPMWLALNDKCMVSHLNLELRRFRHVRIPEDDFHLRFFIEKCMVGIILDSSGNSAGMGLGGLLTYAKIWDVKSLNSLEQLWTNTATLIESEKDSRFAACLLYNCHLDRSSGTVVREIVCLTASKLVFEKAGRDLGSYPLESVCLVPQDIVRHLWAPGTSHLVSQLLYPEVYYIATTVDPLFSSKWGLHFWTHMAFPGKRDQADYSHPSSRESEKLVAYDMHPRTSRHYSTFHWAWPGRKISSDEMAPGALFIRLYGPKFCILVFGPGPNGLSDHRFLSKVLQQLKASKNLFAERRPTLAYRRLNKRRMNSDEIDQLDQVAALIEELGATTQVYEAHKSTSVETPAAQPDG